jgi:hypothetical protein
VPWFTRLHGWFLRARERLYAYVRTLPAFIPATHLVTSIRRAMHQHIARPRASPSWVRQRFNALRRKFRHLTPTNSAKC